MLKKLKMILADFFQQADLVLLGLCCASSLFGIVMIFSATRYMEINRNRNVIVQLAALLLGICVYIAMSMLNLEMVMKKWKWIVVFNVLFILLLLTPFGVEIYGNRAWLRFPFLPVNIGPAEVVKITFVLLLAKQLEWLRIEKRDLKSVPAAMMVGGHAIGICGLYYLVSSDMGNGLVFLFIFVCMAFVAGFALRWFFLLFGAGTVAVAAAWIFEILPGHMRDRFIVLFDHSYQPLDAGWQQTRSLLTLGSGGLFGQGFLNGTQTQSEYGSSLPERHTDFIFSVTGEELGMVGCIIIMVLLAAIILRVLLVAKRAETPFYCYVCVGIAAMLIFQTIINIGMCMFVMPVIGITLPFFSYGGSSVVTLYMAMGLVSGIKKRSLSMRRSGRPLR